MTASSFTRLLLIVAAVCFVGCGDAGPRRYSVSGDITYKGQPIPVGQISFEPDSARGNDGPGSTAIIKEGKYQTTSDGGVVGGPYIVWIAGFDGILPPGGDSPDGTPLFKDRFKATIELPKETSTQNFDVPEQK